MKKVARSILLLIAFTLFTSPLSSSDNKNIQPNAHPKISYCKNKPTKLYTREDYRRWFRECGRLYNVDPYFLEAVAIVETRGRGFKNRLIYGIGPIGRGKFVAPMGIHNCFAKNKYGLNIYDPYDNIELGASSLRGVGYDVAAQKRRLMRYNKTFNMGYFSEIQRIKKELMAISTFETRG